MTVPDEVLRVRTALAGRYAVERELGHGGMATVYLAEDLKHKRKVAIKVLRPELASLVGPQRFLREILIEARLEHPNILPLFDSGEAGGYLYYVMPYIEGESLRDRLEREAQLPLEDALYITREIATALDYAHSRHGVVHRDVKPENILLHEGRAILADFGIARAISEAGGDRVTETGHSPGTPPYMSPEQASGEITLDGRSDIYSLGCVLYEMLAGEPPFTGRTAQAVILKHISERPPSLDVVRPSMPRHVVDALETALAKVPADRFATTALFISALEAPAEHKRRRWAIGVALGALAAAAALVLWVVSSDGVQLDSNKVVVFPLVEAQGLSEQTGVGWDVALAIGAALEHTQPLKWYDGWRYLTESQRVDARLVTPELAAEISRDRSARYYIDGVVRSVGQDLAVVLRLHDVEGDSLILQETSHGTEENGAASVLGLEAVTRLLPPLVDPGRSIDLTPLTDNATGAIALWIQGERAYREAHFVSALDMYRRAVEEDSQLVFAAVKGALAATWEFSFDEASSLISYAVAHDTLIPPKYVEFAHGLAAYFDGSADTAVLRLDSALVLDSEWSEAAGALGEVYHHLIPAKARLDSLARANLEASIAADSVFAPALVHLAEYALREGRLDKAEVYVGRLRRLGPEGWIPMRLDVMSACMQVGGDRFPWDSVALESTEQVLMAAHTFAVGVSQPLCAVGGFEAVLASPEAPRREKWGAMAGLQGLLIAQGRQQEVLALLDSALAAGEPTARVLQVYDAIMGLDVGSRAEEAAEHYRGLYGEHYETASTLMRWLMGVWHLRRGEPHIAEPIVGSVIETARETGGRRDRLLADALSAHLALARGDTSDAVARLRVLRPNAPLGDLAWNLVEPLAVERLLLARLLLALGEYDEAYDVAAAFDHPIPVMYVAFVPASLLIRIEAAEASRRGEDAGRNRERFARLHR